MTTAWPQAAGQVGALLKKLRVVEVVDSTDVTDEGVGITNFARAEGGAIVGSWSRFEGQVMSVTVFGWSSRSAKAPESRSGAEGLTDWAARTWGAATHPWDDVEDAPSEWVLNGRELAIQLFDRRDSTVMVSISDVDLAARAGLQARNGPPDVDPAGHSH